METAIAALSFVAVLALILAVMGKLADALEDSR